MPSYGKLLEHRESKLALLQSTFNATNTRIGLSPVISAQFTLKMCVAAQNCEKKFTKTPYSRASWSSMLVPPESS